MFSSRSRNAWIGTAFAFLAAAATALGQMHPGGGNSHAPVSTHPTMSAMPPVTNPIATMPPAMNVNPLQPNDNRYVRDVAPGTKVPLSRLPRLPAKTMMNTILPRETLHGRHYRLFGAAVFGAHSRMHPHAANGSTIQFYATAAACTSAGTVGSLYTVGCALQWQAVNLDNFSSTDSFQQYYIASNSTTATAAGTAGAPVAADNGNRPVQTTTLSSEGTWTFGVYDVTAQEWVAVAYANAGNTFGIGVYQDSFHLNPSNQFDVSSSSAAFIYLTGLAPADYYVVYVTRTGDTPNCVMISPNTSPTPIPGPTPTGGPTGLLCNPSNSTGQEAPNGTLSVTWLLNSSLEAGTYSVAVYDCQQTCNTAGVTGSLLGQVQVSLTGSGGVTVITEPNGANANPSPAAQPAPTANTTVDWDGTTDQSDSGITGTAGSSKPLTSGHSYTWTLTDPQGQVVALATPAALGAGVTSESQTFQFASANLGFNQATTPALPGQYPSDIWAMQVYDRTAKSVVASQAFKMLGYASTTLFVFPSGSGTTGNAITIPNAGNTVADLRFTNSGTGSYPNAADSFSEIEFSTGPDFNVGHTGHGVIAQLSGCSTANCTGTATDSNGNSWTVTSACSSLTSNNAECNILLTPTVAGTTLTPGAYVTVVGISWTNTNGGSGCGTACEGITSELPVNGLTWSSTTGTVAWSPVYFSISATDAGTASFAVVGSIDCPNGTSHTATPPPFVGTHCFQDRFNHADYQNNSPWAVTNSNESIWAFTITDAAAATNSITELLIQQPALLATQGGVTAVDALSSANWQLNATCPSGFGSQYACIAAKGAHKIAPGGTETIFLDANWPSQSLSYSDFAVLATQTPTPSDTFTLTAASGTNTTIDGTYTTLDNLSVGAYSLNSGLMSAYFSPTSVGTGQTTTPWGIIITNTSTAQDANPDSVDAVIIEESTNKNWTITGTPTVSATGWSNIGTNNPSGNILDYWFGLCGGQYVTADGPPASTPVTAVQNALPECTLPETNALGPGKSMTINMNVLNFGSPSSPITFTMYAHGANGNGWSSGKTFSLITSNESASLAFTKVNSTTISSPTVPSIGAGPNTYTYEVKNTSGSTSIGTVVITLPGTDTSGNNATDSSGNTWTLVGPISSTITLGGTATGCAVNTSGTATFSATTAGANGQITVTCTGFTPGSTLDVTFQSNSPQSQSDSYLFPATIDGSTTGAGALYLGSNEVQVAFSIGLSLAVDPSNPTNGKAHPVPACSPAQCAFSGTTLDFGNIANSSAVTGTDVVAASIIYTGATSAGHTWSLSIESNDNPACTGGTCTGTKEMTADVDATASGTNANGCGAMTYNQTTLVIVPTASTLQLATGPETQCSFSYDVINNYKINIGTEGISGNVATVTYTLIAN